MCSVGLSNPVCILCVIVSLCCLQVIEKRRRDRINHSLTELRRLVPAAFEKQVRSGSFRSGVDLSNSLGPFIHRIHEHLLILVLRTIGRMSSDWKQAIHKYIAPGGLVMLLPAVPPRFWLLVVAAGK